MTAIQVLQAGGATDKGPRSHNEDSYWLAKIDAPAVAKQGYIYIVSDGVGGQAAGEKASSMAVTLIPEYYYHAQQTDPQAKLEEAIEQTNQDIYHAAQQDDRYRGMACTLTVVLIHNNQALVANVGDSRAYLIRKDTIRQITQDHTWVSEQVRVGILTPEEAIDHPRKNIVTRSLGNELAVKIDFFTEPLQPDDQVLLCTDGLSNVVSKSDMVDTLKQEITSPEAAEQLVTLALQHKTTDNVTCLVVSLDSSGAVTPLSMTKKAPQPVSLPLVLLGALVAIALVVISVGVLRGLDSSAGVGDMPETPTDVPPTITPDMTSVALQPTVPISVTPTIVTPIALITPILTPTSTPIPLPRETPKLVSPIDNSTFSSNEPIVFEWSVHPPLQDGEEFQIFLQLMNPEEQQPISSMTLTSRYTDSLEAGEYFWLVHIIDSTNDRFITKSGEGSFTVKEMVEDPESPLPTPTPTPTPTASVTRTITIVEPFKDTPGEATFKWIYQGPPPGGNQGFEVRVWHSPPGQLPAAAGGVHNAVEDNKNGVIKKIGENQYELTIDITGSAPVIEYGGGVYQWKVLLIQIDPYKELFESEPSMRFDFEPSSGQ